MCSSKHVEPSVNFGIINSITKLHLVGISTESSTMNGSMNIKLVKFSLSTPSWPGKGKLYESEWLTAHSDRFTPGRKTPASLCRRLSGPQSQS